MVYGHLFQRIGTPFLPLTSVGIVAAFEGLGILVFWVLYIRTAIRADVPKLTIFADGYLVFGDIPILLEVRMIEGFLQGRVTDIAEGLGHGRAVFNVAIYVYGDFAVEAGVVVVGFGEIR
jgi:hypothetical protein